jgi:hypothetical protein
MKKKILVSAFLLTIGFISVRANDLYRVQGRPAPVTRNVLSTELPAALHSDIKKEYKDYWIADLYEVKDKRRPSYFLTLENADQVVKLSAVDSKNWVMTSTTIKAN